MLTVNEQIGSKIRLLRKEAGLKQEDFGKLFGMSQNRVTNIETGKSSLSFEELLAFADYFKVPTDYILKENGVRKDNPSLQFICDYIGLSEEAVETLRSDCVFDRNLASALCADDSQVEEMAFRFNRNKKNINNFIVSAEFVNIVGLLNRMCETNDIFLSFLALCCNDYNMFAKLNHTDAIKEDISNDIINFLNQFKYNGITYFKERMDLLIFKMQKTILQYCNKNNYIDEIDNDKIEHQLYAYLMLLMQELPKAASEKTHILECVKNIEELDNYPKVDFEEIRSFYEKLKAKEIEKG